VVAPVRKKIIKKSLFKTRGVMSKKNNGQEIIDKEQLFLKALPHVVAPIRTKIAILSSLQDDNLSHSTFNVSRLSRLS
jgi:hypothetical protein